jgi:carboxyl-terminal processing protease
MNTRRVQIFLSVVVILVCSGYMLSQSLFGPRAGLVRSELSECHFLLKHSYVDGADGLALVKAAGRALEAHVPPESVPAWEELDDEESALSWLEQMVVQAESDGMSREEAVYTAMNAMVASLDDPFTSAMDPETYAKFQETLTSQVFGGIGVQLGLGPGGTMVVFKVFEATPAAKAGVLVGDLVLTVDQKNVAGLSPKEVEDLIQGEPGTAVTVEFSRSDKPFTVSLERVILKTRSVRSKLLRTRTGTVVGWITVQGLKDSTGEELREELKELESGSPDGLVLDLRDNMGGYVNAALAVSSQFLDSGIPIVEIKSREETDVKATLSENHSERPLIVFVNGYTASSAEIVAACLQDYERAVLVGERTFGKGSVQSIHEFDSGGALKFTVARYNSPKGRTIDGIGLEPDVQLDEREVLSHCEELWKQPIATP